MRDKKEQNLTLTLPEKKDSGSLLENGFDMPNFTAATEQAINRAGEQLAALGPATLEKARQAMAQAQQALGWQEEDAGKKLQDSLRTLQQQRQRMQDRMRDMQDRQQKLRHDFSGAWADI
jgi:predicted  nucleic acid-binding Zn-ribbon protein